MMTSLAATTNDLECGIRTLLAFSVTAAYSRRWNPMPLASTCRSVSVLGGALVTVPPHGH
jgi:hypothetical protein